MYYTKRNTLLFQKIVYNSAILLAIVQLVFSKPDRQKYEGHVMVMDNFDVTTLSTEIPSPSTVIRHMVIPNHVNNDDVINATSGKEYPYRKDFRKIAFRTNPPEIEVTERLGAEWQTKANKGMDDDDAIMMPVTALELATTKRRRMFTPKMTHRPKTNFKKLCEGAGWVRCRDISQFVEPSEEFVKENQRERLSSAARAREDPKEIIHNAPKTPGDNGSTFTTVL